MEARTPRVNVALHPRRDEDPKTRVKKASKDHEIVQKSNGFVLKRRRTEACENAPPGGAAPPPAAATPAARAAVDARPDFAALPLGSPYLDAYAVSRELYARLRVCLGALPPDAPPAERLAAIATGVCGAELDQAAAAGDGLMTAVLGSVFGAFVRELRGAAERGTVRFADPPAADDDDGDGADAADVAADLAARKAGLRARAAALAAEEARWAAEVEAARAAAAGARAAADARRQAADAGEGGAGEGEGDEGAAAAPPPEAAALARLEDDVHRALACQVDGLCMLVGGVGELVEEANAGARAAQAAYHADKFRAFPHVDSPAALIKQLVRGGGGAA